MNGGSSWYNALQLTAMRKAKNLTLHGTWTWSKLMNEGGWADSTYHVPLRTLTTGGYGGDVPHRVTISGVYTMPVGKGRKFLGNANRIVDGVVGGWEVGAVSRIESGVPFSFGSGWYVLGNPSIEPQVMPNGNIRVVAPCVWSYVGSTLTESQAAKDYGCTSPLFIQRPANAPVQNVVFSGVRMPGTFVFDTNLSKNFRITESMKLQLRMEGFNILNHPLFQNTGTFYTGNDSMFGQIGRATSSGQSNLPRQVQLAVKLMW